MFWISRIQYGSSFTLEPLVDGYGVSIMDLTARYQLLKKVLCSFHPFLLQFLNSNAINTRTLSENVQANLFVRALETGRKENHWRLSCFPAGVQMNFIFSDNVRILCLSCNAKKPLSNCLSPHPPKKKAESSVVLIFYMISSVKSALHVSGTRRIESNTGKSARQGNLRHPIEILPELT